MHTSHVGDDIADQDKGLILEVYVFWLILEVYVFWLVKAARSCLTQTVTKLWIRGYMQACPYVCVCKHVMLYVVFLFVDDDCVL